MLLTGFTLDINYKCIMNIYSRLCLVLSFVLSLINSTKVLQGDLFLYKVQFENSNGLDLLTYIFINLKDPLYYLLNYLVFNFISDSFSVFLFINSFISYSFLLIGIKNLAIFFKFKKKDILLVILSTALFPLLFSFSAGILRQFMAICVAIYFISCLYKNNSNKTKNLYLLSLTILLHSSNVIFLFFISFFLIEFNFKKKIKIIISTILLFLFIINSNYFQLFIPALARVNDLKGRVILDELSLFSITIISLMFLFITYLFFKEKIQKAKYFIGGYICVFCIFYFFYFQNNTELTTRLLPIIYAFWPLFIFYFLKLKNINIFFKIVFTLFIFLLFISNLFFGIYTYNFFTLY